jgi:carboxylesterase type B
MQKTSVSKPECVVRHVRDFTGVRYTIPAHLELRFQRMHTACQSKNSMVKNYDEFSQVFQDYVDQDDERY